jgi:hypothetical protein
MVEGFLLWARNYREIERFEKLEGGGRCWKITLPDICRAHGGDGPLLPSFGEDDPVRIVPREFVLTQREALAFGYGVAVGGRAERRSEFAEREWKWGVEPDEEPEEAPERAPDELTEGGG